MTAVFADHTIQPSLDATRQLEVITVDCECQSVSKNAFVEPVRNSKLDSRGAPILIGWRRITLDPVKSFRHLSSALPDISAYQSAAEPLEGFYDPLILIVTCSTINATKQLLDRNFESRRRCDASSLRLPELGGSPDQDIGIPYCGDTNLDRCGYIDTDGSGSVLYSVLDWLGTPLLREAEEGPLHHILLVVGWDVTG
jgi:hypothetical protein